MARTCLALGVAGIVILQLSLTRVGTPWDIRLPISLATLSDTGSMSGSFVTDALNPPTGLTASGGATAALSWVPTVDAYADGYRILRSSTSGSGYALVGTATPQTASGYTDAPASDGTYFYVVGSYRQNWSSVNSAEASAAVQVGVTGFHACTSQLLDTGGDNNGYQGSPGNACQDDGVVATDTNSGTGTSTSCTSPAKDRHRFWNFGFGLPGTVVSIDGIEVRIKAGIDALAGTNRICAQLSWDAGLTWTPAQQVNLTSVVPTTYTLGGPAFLWGRSWTVVLLSDLNFRVRLTNVSINNARDFTLDAVEVQVNYTP